MPLVEAKCPNCGASLSVDNSKEAAVCDFCGTPYIVEKAVTGAISNSTINNSVINVYNTGKSEKKELSQEELYERYVTEFKALKKEIWHDKVRHALKALIIAGIGLIVLIIGLCMPDKSNAKTLMPIFGGLTCVGFISVALRTLITDSASDIRKKRKLNEAYENAHFKKMFK